MTSIMHIFQVFIYIYWHYGLYVYLFPISLSDYLSVSLCVFTWQKIDQSGRPQTFF